MNASRTRRLAALLSLGLLVACVAAQTAPPSGAFWTPEAYLAFLADPARHVQEPHALPLPGEPVVFLVFDPSPELHAALCRKEVVESLAGKGAFVHADPSEPMAKFLEGARILAMRGTAILGRYVDGELPDWVAGMIDGRGIRVPSMDDATVVAHWTGEDWGHFMQTEQALLAVGRAPQAQAQLVRAWQYTAGSPKWVGVRDTAFVTLWIQVLQADGDRARPVLEDMLADALAQWRESPDTVWLVAKDAVAYCRILQRPDRLAQQLEDLSHEHGLNLYVLNFIRDDAFALLAESPQAPAARLLLPGSLSDYLEAALRDMVPPKSRNRSAETPELEQFMAERRAALMRHASRVALLAGDEPEASEVALALHTRCGTAGLAVFVGVARELGPPTALGRRLATALLGAQDAATALPADEAAAIRSWLAG